MISSMIGAYLKECLRGGKVAKGQRLGFSKKKKIAVRTINE